MSTNTTTVTRPDGALRSDARRNQARIVAAAATVFAEHGADASLNEVARRARVGPATLYRHFRTREALLSRLLADRHDALAAEARRLAEDPASAEALLGWLRAFMNHVSTYRGLAALVKAGREEERSAFALTFASLINASGQLLAQTQQSGEIRADVDVCDLLDLANALAIITDDDGARAERLLDLAFEGVRTSHRRVVTRRSRVRQRQTPPDSLSA